MRPTPLRTLFLAILLSLSLTATPFAASKKHKKPAEDKAPQAEVFSGYVVRVLDGDTIDLDGGRRVRLLDINTPEIRHPGQEEQPYAREAADALRSMVFGQYVTVQPGHRKKDKFDRLLGHIFLPGGGWVNGTLVRDGYAHVYTFPEDLLYPNELLAYEDQARKAKKGLWALPRWRTRSATTCCQAEDVGTFEIVEGKVLNATHVARKNGDRTYFNFGPDWKTDFSVFINDKDLRFFRKVGIKDPIDAYNGHTVRIHGYIQPVNGMLVRVTHPAQIEILQ